MDPCVAPRPTRRVNFCFPCVKRLKNGAANQLSITDFCDRDNANAKCNQCRTGGNRHNCDPIPPQFNRAINILIALKQSVVAAPPGSESRTRREDRCRAYAVKFVDTVNAWNLKDSKAREKDKDWEHKRQKSYEDNMRRFNQGIGFSGLLTPRNEFVDESLEMGLHDLWVQENQWWYLRVNWYGNVP
jgi:predicted metal-binding protein